MADPRLWSIHPRLRSEREFGTPPKPKLKKEKGKRAAPEPVQTSAEEITPDRFWVSEKEKRKFGEQKDTNRVQILISSVQKALEQAAQVADESEKRRLLEKAVGTVPKASDSRHPNFFADIANLREVHWGAADLVKLPANVGKPVHLVSGKALWGHVKDQAWKRCMAINAERLRAWNIDPPKEWIA